MWDSSDPAVGRVIFQSGFFERDLLIVKADAVAAIDGDTLSSLSQRMQDQSGWFGLDFGGVWENGVKYPVFIIRGGNRTVRYLLVGYEPDENYYVGLLRE